MDRIISILIFSLVSAAGYTQDVKIDTKNADDLEKQGKEQMERIIKRYHADVNGWLYTRRVMIDKNVIPFSHRRSR